MRDAGKSCIRKTDAKKRKTKKVSAGKRNWKKRVTSSVLVLCMLFVFLLSASGTMTVEASGLLDDTVDAANLYSKYPIANYQLDYYTDVSWGWLPWNWVEMIGSRVANVMYSFTDMVWQLGTFISSGTGYVVQEAYKLDFVGDMADAIGKNIQTLAGLSKSGMSQDGFYPGFLMLVILSVGIYAAYTGLIKRETSKAVSAIVNMLAIFILTAGFIVYAPDYIKNVNEFSSDVSTGALELGTKMTMPGNEEMGNEAVDKIRNTIFSIQVYKPWLLLQFGTTDEEALGEERIEAILSIVPDKALMETRQDAVKADIETYENVNMTALGTLNRLGMTLFLFIINLIISIFIFMMCGMLIASQMLFIIYALFLPVSFALSMFPTYNGMVKKAVMKVFNVIMMRAGLTLIVTVAFSISAMVYSMSGDYSFFMVGFLQIVIFAGIYLKINDILAMVSLQDADSGGNRRGGLMRSLGRYIVMHRMFGRYGRRKISGKRQADAPDDRMKKKGPERSGGEEASRADVSAGYRAGAGVGFVLDIKDNMRDKASRTGARVQNVPTQASYAVYRNTSDFKCGITEERERRQNVRSGQMQADYKDMKEKKTEMELAALERSLKRNRKNPGAEEVKRIDVSQRKKRERIALAPPNVEPYRRNYEFMGLHDSKTGKVKTEELQSWRESSGIKKAGSRGFIYRSPGRRVKFSQNASDAKERSAENMRLEMRSREAAERMEERKRNAAMERKRREMAECAERRRKEMTEREEERRKEMAKCAEKRRKEMDAAVAKMPEEYLSVREEAKKQKTDDPNNVYGHRRQTGTERKGHSSDWENDSRKSGKSQNKRTGDGRTNFRRNQKK